MTHQEDEKKKLGRQLAKVRKAAGFTLESAAAAMTERDHPITKGAIGRWEAGDNLPDALRMRQLARLYGVPVDTLYGDESIGLETLMLASQLRAVVLNERKGDAVDQEMLQPKRPPPKNGEQTHNKGKPQG